MANHVRQQVREALATLLTNLTTTGTRVFQSRIRPLADNELPCLMISTNQEDIEMVGSNTDPALERSLTIRVTAVAKATATLDDTLDTIIKEVEVKLNASIAANTLNNLVKGISLNGIEIEFSDETEKPVGQAVMSFTALYYTLASTPDASI
jgi:hypothetical protein